MGALFYGTRCPCSQSIASHLLHVFSAWSVKCPVAVKVLDAGKVNFTMRALPVTSTKHVRMQLMLPGRTVASRRMKSQSRRSNRDNLTSRMIYTCVGAAMKCLPPTVATNAHDDLYESSAFWSSGWACNQPLESCLESFL